MLVRGQGQKQVIKSKEGLDDIPLVAPCCLREVTLKTLMCWIWAHPLRTGHFLKTVSKAIGRGSYKPQQHSTREMQPSTFSLSRSATPSLECSMPGNSGYTAVSELIMSGQHQKLLHGEHYIFLASLMVSKPSWCQLLLDASEGYV